LRLTCVAIRDKLSFYKFVERADYIRTPFGVGFYILIRPLVAVKLVMYIQYIEVNPTLSSLNNGGINLCLTTINLINSIALNKNQLHLEILGQHLFLMKQFH
jgi:hypothetical protein